MKATKQINSHFNKLLLNRIVFPLQKGDRAFSLVSIKVIMADTALDYSPEHAAALGPLLYIGLSLKHILCDCWNIY
jgi:hypothetical protein